MHSNAHQGKVGVQFDLYTKTAYTQYKNSHTHTVSTIFGVSVRVLVRVTLNLRQLTHHLADWRIDPLNKQAAHTYTHIQRYGSAAGKVARDLGL